MHFARLNGVVLHHQVIGGPKGKPPLVFINSLGSDFRIWRDVIVRMVGEYPVVTYDKRGHGLSEIGDRPVAIDDHARDLCALLDHLHLSGAVLVGLSIGGMIAQMTASMRPDLVSAMVLSSTSYKIGTPALWDQRIETIQSKGMGVAGDAIRERWFTADYRAQHPDDVTGYVNMVARTPLAGYVGSCAAIRDANLHDIAETLAVPVSCVVGDQDLSTTPDVVLDLARTIPGARYDVIKDAGHLPCIDQPVALADIIKAFVADVASPAH